MENTALTLHRSSVVLNNDIAAIEKVFETQELLSERQNSEAIQNYYLSNRLSYLVFHSLQGFMHMGISYNPRYSPLDLIESLTIVDNYLLKTTEGMVLELGAGKGSNSLYLARKHPDTKFFGIDLSAVVLRKLKWAENYQQERGDFHDLSRYADNSLDLVFVIEALCHSQMKEKVLSEVFSKLKKGGYFIILDGYSRKSLKRLTWDEKLAKKLVERSMAVEEFELIDQFRKKIDLSKFKVVKESDLSKNILPSLLRFERLARIFYASPILAKFLKSILPTKITQNSIAGLLMPSLVKRGVGCYYLHVLQKPS